MYHLGIFLQRHRWFLLTLLIAAAAFCLFALPNARASENLSMVLMFEPDEAGPLPYMLHMIAPAPSVDKALRGFLFYEYYYYGFPFFAYSAILMLPLQWLNLLGNIPLVMLVLRQFVSVMPMLAAMLLLVYMQDGFRSYRSPVLLAFLVSVPAVLGNAFWWHPDGITLLLVVLTIFFLRRDNLRFGWNFLLAAVMCGLITAIKLMGVYFFLAVGLTLLLGFVQKKASWKRLLGMAAAFILLMAVSYVAGDPFLLSHWARTAYMNTMVKQTEWLSLGYGVVYAKGLLASWPVMHQFYGEWPFLLAALGAAVWGVWRGPPRMLHALILAWFVPVSGAVLWITHFKYQYWLPAALPLFSCLAVVLPKNLHAFRLAGWRRYLQAALLLVVAAQFVLFLAGDVPNFVNRYHRADNNARIQFYHSSVQALQPLGNAPVRVYYDYRLYAPETPGWATETTFDLLEYGFIQQNNYDVLLLLEQRIRDYLNPDVTGIDPATFARNQQFYRDADKGTITGYHLVYRNAVGLVYVRAEVYQKYWGK